MASIVLHPKPRVFTRDWRARLMANRLALLLFVLLLTLYLVTSVLDFQSQGKWTLVTTGGVVLLGCVAWFSAKANALISISEDTIVYRNAFRVRRSCKRDAVRRLVRLQIFLGNQRVERLLILGDQDRSLLVIQSSYFSDFDQLRICQILSVPMSETPGTMRAKVANRQFPGAASLFYRHPSAVTFGGLVAVAVLALLAAGVVIAVSRP
jgi:hypothetical protein